MTIRRPMFPPRSTRRHFLSGAAGVAAGGTALALATIPPAPAAAAPASALDPSKASPALRTAVKALGESHDRLEAAKARFIADDAKLANWDSSHPKPSSKRGLKRWSRKWRENRDAVESESWAAQLAAEKDFQAAQLAVANVTPRDEDDLVLKAAAAFVYDRVKCGYGSIAVISYSVALDLFKQRMPACA
jgi:hypothetical protein